MTPSPVYLERMKDVGRAIGGRSICYDAGMYQTRLPDGTILPGLSDYPCVMRGVVERRWGDHVIEDVMGPTNPNANGMVHLRPRLPLSLYVR